MNDRPPLRLVHALVRQLRLIETMAWDPAVDATRVHAKAVDAYRTSGTYSLLVTATTASARSSTSTPLVSAWRAPKPPCRSRQ